MDKQTFDNVEDEEPGVQDDDHGDNHDDGEKSEEVDDGHRCTCRNHCIKCLGIQWHEFY